MITKVYLPNLGNIDNATIVEILVAKGQRVKLEEPLMLLEGEKAAIEVPSPVAGTIHEIKCKVGDILSNHKLLLLIDAHQDQNSKNLENKKSVDTKISTNHTDQQVMEIKLPNIGIQDKVEVIEILAKVGDYLAVDDILLSVESEKTSISIPSMYQGQLLSLNLNTGDMVTSGQVIGTIQLNYKQQSSAEVPKKISKVNENSSGFSRGNLYSMQLAVHASPAVRRLARELGVDLNLVLGTGRKQRIVMLDVKNYVKQSLAKNNIAHTINPLADFSKYGDTHIVNLKGIRKHSAKHVYNSWVNIPHVTHFDEIDITDLEKFRKKLIKQHNDEYKISLLAFIIKALIPTLKAFPNFNASFDATNEAIIVKEFYNIGVAVDTPKGLLVPVIKDVHAKSIIDIAIELIEVSLKAKKSKLANADMSGNSFSVSSLGGIGGVGFTPIINLPDVAILGIARAKKVAAYVDDVLLPRYMLPISLSYDHRVLDGADAARFTNRFSLELTRIYNNTDKG